MHIDLYIFTITYWICISTKPTNQPQVILKVSLLVYQGDSSVSEEHVLMKWHMWSLKKMSGKTLFVYSEKWQFSSVACIFTFRGHTGYTLF